MMTKMEIESMTPEECANLAIMLWERGYASKVQDPLTEAQQNELRKRFEYSELHPENRMPWRDFMSKFSV